MSVSIRPEKLVERVSLKLNTASFNIHNLRETEQPRFNGHWNAENYAVDFLQAAHGVFALIKTFGDANLTPAGFKRWLEGWETAALSSSEKLAMWRQLRLARTSEEHGDGASFIRFDVEVTQGDMQVARPTILNLAPGAPAPKTQIFKSTVRFAAYPNRAASDVCQEYWELCHQLADDFVRDHSHLIPAAV
jgi:hypothetical protein